MQQVSVNDKYQTNYSYQRTESVGENFFDEFMPELTPPQMLEMGVFGGDYFDIDSDELPSQWFENARLSTDGTQQADCNYFEINASQPLQEWERKGWIYPDDPRGWFQWYARYYLGRRLPEEDIRQIKRWKAIRRHAGQIRKACAPGDVSCRRKQRQALLHWAYDSRKI
jgi:hypothetical protein